jgi:branched-chain amino acid transport system ATP-binding protein
MTAVLQVTNLRKTFGGITAVNDVSFDVHEAEILGIIGPNGSGKTTLVNCICGSLSCDGGSIGFDGTDVTRFASYQRTRLGIARSFQVPRPFSSMTLAENVAVPLEYVVRRRPLHSTDVSAEARSILARMGLADRADAPTGSLTQVGLRKLELARAMAARPRLLILDEVMAGLSHVEVDEMLDIILGLSRQGVTVMMIEHIMRAIMRFSERVVCMDAGRVMAEGPPDQIVRDPGVQRIYLGA